VHAGQAAANAFPQVPWHPKFRERMVWYDLQQCGGFFVDGSQTGRSIPQCVQILLFQPVYFEDVEGVFKRCWPRVAVTPKEIFPLGPVFE
jgi:hypothetical protein